MTVTLGIRKRFFVRRRLVMQDCVQMTDESGQLFKAIAAGDEQALAKLYDQYGALLFSIARSIVGDSDTAAEITQDAFVAVWRNAGDYDANQASASTWLARIVRNRALDHLRRNNALRRTPQQLLAEFAEAGGDAADLDLGIELQAERDAMRRALKQLPAEQRSMIQLAYLFGYSLAELAEATGHPIGTVKSRIFRGLAQLRTILENDPQ